MQPLNPRSHIVDHIAVRPHRRFSLLLAATAALWLAAPLAAQPLPFGPMCGGAPFVDCNTDITGPFASGENSFFQNSGGLLEDIPGGTLAIDQNCNGTVNDPADITVATPGEITNIRNTCPSCIIQWRLTPSQDFIYARVFSPNSVFGCSAETFTLLFYAIDPGPTLTPFTGNGRCLTPVGGGPSLAIEPIFHDYPGFPVRTGVAAGRAESFGQPVVWIDLVGRELTVDNITYDGPIDDIKFAPAGNAALLVSNTGGADTQWALADLCADPLGGVVSTGTPAGNVTAQITGAPGNLLAVLDVGGGTTVPIPVGDCLCGACCDGSTCTDNTFARDCTEFIAGAACSNNPCGGTGLATLTVDFAGAGAGRVSSTDGSVFCTSPCTTDFPAGTLVALEARASSGSVFTHWSGDCAGTSPTAVVQLAGDRTCVANFAIPTVDVAIQGVTVNPSLLIAGLPGTFTIDVAELDNAFDAAFVEVELELPAGLTFDPATSDPRCSPSFDGRTVDCALSPLAAGATEAVAIGFTIAPTLRGGFNLAATATTFTQDTNLANNTRSFTATIAGRVDLGATLTATPDPVRPGGTLGYTIEIQNAGPSSALNILLNELLAPELTLLDEAGMPGGTPCAVPEIAPNTRHLITLLAQVDATTPNGTPLTTTVNLSADESDPDLSNNTAAATVTVDANAAAPAAARRRVVTDGQNLPNGDIPSYMTPPAHDDGAVAFAALGNSFGRDFQPSVYRWYDGVLQTITDFNATPPFYDRNFANVADIDISGLEVAFWAGATTGFNSYFSGLYTSATCGVEPILQQGDPTPGLTGEFTSGGGVKHVDGVTLYWDNGEIFTIENGVITTIALRNAPMPGNAGDTFSSYGFNGWDFDGTWVAFRGLGGDEIQLPGGGTALTRIGIYAWNRNTQTLVKVVDNTDTAPNGSTYYDLNSDVAVDDGLVVFMNGSLGANPDELYLHDLETGSTSLIVDENTPLPAGAPRTFDGVSTEYDIDAGRVLFSGRGNDARGNGFYIWENGAIRRVMAEVGRISTDALSGDRFAYRVGGFFGSGPTVVLAQGGDPGDFDLNGAVDSDDAAQLLIHFTGPLQFPLGGPGDYWSALTTFDHDLDDDLDLDDLARLQQQLGAP